MREIYVDSAVSDYIVRLVNATRNHPDIYLGASPRGSLALYRAGQAFAALAGRDYVIPDDVKALAVPALAHRLIVKTAATVRDVDSALIVRELLDSVPIESRIPKQERHGRPAGLARIANDGATRRDHHPRRSFCSSLPCRRAPSSCSSWSTWASSSSAARTC